MSAISPAARRPAAAEVLVARQPILDRLLRPHAYELLYRAARRDAYPAGVGADQATAAVIARSFLTLGLGAVTGGKPAFVNVTRQIVHDGQVTALDPRAVVLELGADVGTSDATVLAALRRQGYRLMLDNFVDADPRAGLLPVVDGVKLDFRRTDPAARRRVAATVRARSLDLVGLKVETRAESEEAFALGCDWVQGYFFAEPLVVSRRQAPGFKPTHQRLLEAVGGPEIDAGELEALIKTDLLLSHQFLRYINSAHFGWRRRIDSLRHAFVLLGDDRTRKWVSLVVMADLAQDKPQQLAVTACLRGRFCELVGGGIPGFAHRRLDLFLMGMFSIIDVVLDRPMIAALAGIPLASDVEAALLGDPGGIRGVLDLVLTYERGDWDGLERRLAGYGVDSAPLLEHYLEAVEWVSKVFEPTWGEEP